MLPSQAAPLDVSADNGGSGDGPSLEISAAPRSCRRTVADGEDDVVGGDGSMLLPSKVVEGSDVAADCCG